MLLYPAKSLTKYKIGNKEIIIIGEIHLHTINQTVDSEYVWDFVDKKINEGYEINLELNPLFKEELDSVISNIKSINIKQILVNAKKKQKLQFIKGVDYRTINDFFGSYRNENMQVYFMNKHANLKNIKILQFFNVIDNMMIFTNKHFYDKFKNIIVEINKPYLDLLFFAHKKTDKHINFLKAIIDNKDLTFDETLKIFNNIIYDSDFEQIIDDIRNFILLFSDLLTLIQILYSKKNKHILLIGETHANNFKQKFQQYITYPNLNIKSKKLTTKQLKKLGTEIKPHYVSIHLLNK